MTDSEGQLYVTYVIQFLGEKHMQEPLLPTICLLYSRQTISQLCLCLYPSLRSGTPRPALLLGCSNLQLWVLILGDSGKPVNPASPDCQIYGWDDIGLGGDTYCTYWSEELCWDPSVEVSPGNG